MANREPRQRLGIAARRTVAPAPLKQKKEAAFSASQTQHGAMDAYIKGAELGKGTFAVVNRGVHKEVRQGAGCAAQGRSEGPFVSSRPEPSPALLSQPSPPVPDLPVLLSKSLLVHMSKRAQSVLG